MPEHLAPAFTQPIPTACPQTTRLRAGPVLSASWVWVLWSKRRSADLHKYLAAAAAGGLGSWAGRIPVPPRGRAHRVQSERERERAAGLGPFLGYLPGGRLDRGQHTGLLPVDQPLHPYRVGSLHGEPLAWVLVKDLDREVDPEKARKDPAWAEVTTCHCGF